MEQGERAVIRSYDDLIARLAAEADKLKKKADQQYLWRYVFRRIPLFFGFGLIFFAICFAMTLRREQGVTEMNDFLHGWWCWVLQGVGEELLWRLLVAGVPIAFVLALLFCPCVSSRKQPGEDASGQGTPTPAVTDDVNPCGQRIGLLVLAICAVLLFGLVLAHAEPLYLGLSLFASITLIAMWTDRTLGFTRASERNYLFAGRADRLRELLEFRKSKSIELEEKDLQEVAALFDELALSKYRDTVGDTFFLLKHLERLKLPGSDKKDGGSGH